MRSSTALNASLVLSVSLILQPANVSPVLIFPLFLSYAAQLCSAVLHAWMHHPLKHKHISLLAFVRDVFFIQSLPGQQPQSPWGW